MYEACLKTAPAVKLPIYWTLRAVYACVSLVNRRASFAVYDALYAVERAVMA